MTNIDEEVVEFLKSHAQKYDSPLVKKNMTYSHGHASNTENKTRRNYKRTVIYVSRFTLQIPVKIPYKKYDNDEIKSIFGPKMSLKKKRKNT